MGKCGGGKPYSRMSDNPKMQGSGGALRPYITGGLVGPAMQYSNDMDKKKKRDDDEDDEEKMAKAKKSRKKGSSYGTGMG
jgi:hypothetical protein